MKAILCRQLGGPEDLVLEDVPTPSPGPGEVRIRVRAAGVNFADTLMIAGLYQSRPELPFSPGFEVAGEVVELGEGVTTFTPGDRVAAFGSHGGYAEEAITPASTTYSIPDEMDGATGASFIVAYGTAHIALTHRVDLQPGEVLLVHGASGGVGLAAVEVGKHLGATVIATAGTQAKLDLAADHGADHCINYREGEFFGRVRELTDGRGADVIFDPVGGDVFDQSLRCINWGGRLLVIGFASGRIPQAPVNIPLLKNCSIVGLFWGAYPQREPKVVEDSLHTLMGWYAEGRIGSLVSRTYPLAEAGAALGAVMNREALGRLVLIPG